MSFLSERLILVDDDQTINNAAMAFELPTIQYSAIVIFHVDGKVLSAFACSETPSEKWLKEELVNIKNNSNIVGFVKYVIIPYNGSDMTVEGVNGQYEAKTNALYNGLMDDKVTHTDFVTELHRITTEFVTRHGKILYTCDDPECVKCNMIKQVYHEFEARRAIPNNGPKHNLFLMPASNVVH